MCILVTKRAPNFSADALFPDGEIRSLSLADYLGKYVLLFFYPMDFTFVCPTEIIGFSDAYDEFKDENVQILGCSVDSVYSHHAWWMQAREDGGLGQNLRFPLVSDFNRNISFNYNVLLEKGMAARGLFIIDREGIVRHQTVNDLSLGRSIEEALRLVRALKFVEQNGEVCPMNWRSGDPAIKPTVKDSLAYFQRQYGHFVKN
ncbi:MAG: peroxiredoxin [Planctomycetia bacterium]|nr:peroxiredoxin [Planctomycetia bacterium]